MVKLVTISSAVIGWCPVHRLLLECGADEIGRAVRRDADCTGRGQGPRGEQLDCAPEMSLMMFPMTGYERCKGRGGYERFAEGERAGVEMLGGRWTTFANYQLLIVEYQICRKVCEESRSTYNCVFEPNRIEQWGGRDDGAFIELGSIRDGGCDGLN